MKRPWLAPLIPAYAAAVALRNWRIETGREPVRKLNWPVVSIGNLSAGGAGKTPLAIAMARGLKASGYWVDVLSRGYGRVDNAVEQVETAGSPARFGDEPLLIARAAGVPVYVAPQRYDAGCLAEAGSATPSARAVHLLDDGFQHRQLARDLDIVLLDTADWHGRLLPAGNLREPLKALSRAQVAAIPANEPDLERALQSWGWRGPVWRLRRLMETPGVDGPVLAFCGIARPNQFFCGLEAGGMKLAARVAFADHLQYTPIHLQRLHARAKAAGAVALVTTEKDHVRLEHQLAALAAPLPVLTAKLRIEIEDEPAALAWLARHIDAVLPRASL